MRTHTKTIPLLTLLALIGTSGEADACGGLFCSSSNPVNQAAERIIFAQDGDRVNAVIEIQYQGPAREFAWLLPVPGGEAVEVGVSSKQALDALQQQSNPQYNFITTFEQCPFDGDQATADDDAVASDDDSFAPEPESGPGAVTVVAAGTVGPYDYVQLAVDESLPNPADAAVVWLEDNEFDVSNVGADLLRSYLEGGLDLIAFKLTKGNDTGSIRPVALSWTADYPVIPIRPTAVAANDDMGVMVWVLGEARAVPTNYFHLEINEAKINWFNPGPTYNDVIIAAADEAGGQGFVTEQSTGAGTLRSALLPEYTEYRFDLLRAGQFADLPTFFQSVVNTATTFSPVTFEPEFYDGFSEVMGNAELLPLREGATAEQFIDCVACYFETDVAVRNDRYPSTPYDPETDPINQINVPAFLDGLDAAVLTPLRQTRALFRPELTATRFYTTLSAEEMTVDPAFDFNADLEPVDNIHSADRYIRCDGSQSITLPQGLVLQTQDGFTWPVSLDDELPMNFRVLQLSTAGQGEVAIDNTDRIVEVLRDLEIGDIADDEPGEVPVGADDDVGDDDATQDDDATADDDATQDDDATADDDATQDDDATADDDATQDDDATADDATADDDATQDDDATADDDVMEAVVDPDGCACRVPGHKPLAGGPSWLAALPLALWFVRRRRR